jgi:nicrotizing toxin Mtb-like protein
VLGGLRDQLNALGLTPAHIRLPGEESAGPPLEGALRVRADDGRFVLETVDYGHPFRLLTADSGAEITNAVMAYVSRPLPAARVISRDELHTIVARVSRHYDDLRAQLSDGEGFVVDMPPGIPIDRIGTLDGVHTYPIDTPFEARSLPPTALGPETSVYKFVTAAAIRVQPIITRPWFGRPGGGIRFTLQYADTGLRDLVVSGQLQLLQVVDSR